MAVRGTSERVPTDVMLDLCVVAKEEGRRRHAGSLANALRSRGVSLEELSKLLGVTPSTIRGWMSMASQFDKESRA